MSDQISTDVPTTPSRARPRQRPRHFRVCYDEDGKANDSNDSVTNTAESRPQPWGVAPVNFQYEIETSVLSSDLSPRAQSTITNSVSAAIINSIHKHDCSPRRRRARRRRRQEALSDLPSFSALRSRRTEILSISPGDWHEWKEECVSEYKIGSLSCNEVEGTVVIGFDELDFSATTIGSGGGASDFRSVGNVVLSRVEEDMNDGNYLEKVNNDILELGVVVTKLKYVGSDFLDRVDKNEFEPVDVLLDSTSASLDTTDGITLFSKVAIPIMVTLFLLAMVLCWCAVSTWPTDWLREKMSRGNENNKSLKRGSRKPSFGKEREEPDLERHTRRSLDYKNKSLPSSITIKGNIGNNDVDKGRIDASKIGDRKRKSRTRTPSLEATLHDLTETEKKNYGNHIVPLPMDNRNGRSYSTLPVDNRASVSRFLHLPVRPKSMIHVVDGHPSDTETGSTAHSVGIVNNELRYKDGNMGDPAQRYSFPILSSPRAIISSLFTRSSPNEHSRNPSPVIDLVDRVNACTPGGNVQCFRHESELPTNNRSENETVLRYVVPTDDRVNSLVESPNADAVKSPSKRMSAKKSEAYRAYINRKIRQRAEECEEYDKPIPMEIGVKRTFTDGQGRVREMVAL